MKTKKIILLLFLMVSFSLASGQGESICGDNLKSNIFLSDTKPYPYVAIEFEKGTLVLKLFSLGITDNKNKHGVVLFINNGFPVEKPLAEIESDFYEAVGYSLYTVLIPLTRSDISMLRENKLTKYQFKGMSITIAEDVQLALMAFLNN